MRIPMVIRVVVVASCLLGAATASADETPAAGTERAPNEVQSLETVLGAAKCDPAAIKDPRLAADLRQSIRHEVHEEDADNMLTNKKHVVMAYAAMLALLALFVVGLFLRQNKLVAEIDRLESELDAAIKEG